MRRIAPFVLPTMLLWTSACATSSGASGSGEPTASFCTVFKPIPLSDADIAALSRPAKEAIAVDNETWLACPKP